MNQLNKNFHLRERRGLVMSCLEISEFKREPANLATVLLLEGVLKVLFFGGVIWSNLPNAFCDSSVLSFAGTFFI